MKRIVIVIVLVMVLLTACAGKPAAQPAAALKVSGGSIEKSYTAADLKALGSAQASFKDVQYTGVQLAALLKDAGFDPSAVSAVKAVASDGFTANYDSALFNREDTLVAYATANGALSADDGAFRMVLPAEAGKLNPRNLVEIQVIEK